MSVLDEKGLPANLDAERFVLGSILLDDSIFVAVAGELRDRDFVLEKHQKIFRRMVSLYERSEPIDRVTVANELMSFGELESVDGLSYLISLDDGIPHIPNIDSYVKIIRDKSTMRGIVFASQALLNRALYGTESAEDILAGAEETLLGLSGEQTKEGLLYPAQVIQRFPGGLNAFLDPSKRPKGLSTGFTRLDEMTGGLRPGELWILAARPSMGKTALAMNIASHVAVKHKGCVSTFSLEMSADSLLTRILCANAYVDSHRFRLGYLNPDERRKLAAAAQVISESRLLIDDTSGVHLMDIHSKVRKTIADHGCDLVIVDYLQLMGTKGRVENRQQEISGISRGFKLMAKDLKVPMLVLSQLSRAPEQRPGDHRPQLADLRESGSIEQDADVVAFVFREEVYKRDRDDLRGLAELIVAKQRNGPIGKVDLVFLHALTKFENRAEDLGTTE